MRDLICPKSGCGEPVESDYLHDVSAETGKDFTALYKDFKRKGCEAVGLTHSTGNPEIRFEMSAALMDILGDDMDGAINMMEDWEAGF